MGSKSNWKDEEKEYLIENYGTLPIGTIAKHLGRSETGVVQMKVRLGLGSFLDNGDYITVNALSKALGYGNFDTYKLTSWVNNRGFPIRKKKVQNNYFRVIYIDEFWKWAKKNRDLLDFSRFEKNVLGVEPEWVDEKRKHDFAKKQRYKTTPWTPYEDAKLTRMVKMLKYSYDDISKELKRTCGAVERRLVDLGIKERPVKAYNHTKWTDEEISLLIDLIVQGYGYEMIAERFKRSSKAIRGKIGRMYHTENLDKVRDIIEKERIVKEGVS